MHETGLVLDRSSWVPGEVEVFNHVPDLPPGWGEHGREPGREPEPSSHASPASPASPASLATPVPEAAVSSSRRFPVLGAALLILGLLLIAAAVLVALLG